VAKIGKRLDAVDGFGVHVVHGAYDLEAVAVAHALQRAQRVECTQVSVSKLALNRLSFSEDV
jgi:hypothetical protein